MESFEELLEISTKIHGHICAGQVIGVRMAMLGLRRIGIDDPKGADRKKLYVIVEIDRCATDALQSVTGCSLGKRSLRWMDFGIMAAAFVNLENGRAVRVTAREEARELSAKYRPELADKYRRQLEAYRVMPEEELFTVQEVKVDIAECDLPGRPLRRVQCAQCGDYVQDCREMEQDGRIICRACAGQRYWRAVPAKESCRMEATDILMQEHRMIERVITALETAAGRLAAGGTVPADFFLTASDFIRNFADGSHHAKEEGILFAALAANGMPRDSGPVAVMLREHEEGRRLTKGMREAAERLRDGDPAAAAQVAENALGYAELLRQHIHKEDPPVRPCDSSRPARADRGGFCAD